MPSEDNVTFLGRFNEYINDLKWIKSTMDQTPETNPELEDPYTNAKKYVFSNMDLSNAELIIGHDRLEDSQELSSEHRYEYMNNSNGIEYFNKTIIMVDPDGNVGSTPALYNNGRYKNYLTIRNISVPEGFNTTELQSTLVSYIDCICLYNTNGGYVKEGIPIGEVFVNTNEDNTINICIQIYPDNNYDGIVLVENILNSSDMISDIFWGSNVYNKQKVGVKLLLILFFAIQIVCLIYFTRFMEIYKSFFP